MENKKPIIIEMEEVKNEFVQTVNNALQNRGIPCYFLELIIKDIVRELQTGAKNELAMAKEQTEKVEIEQTEEA